MVRATKETCSSVLLTARIGSSAIGLARLVRVGVFDGADFALLLGVSGLLGVTNVVCNADVCVIDAR